MQIFKLLLILLFVATQMVVKAGITPKEVRAIVDSSEQMIKRGAYDEVISFNIYMEYNRNNF